MFTQVSSPVDGSGFSVDATLHNMGYSLRICQCCFAPVCTYSVVTDCYINSHNCRNMSIKHPRTVGMIDVSSTCDYGYLITRGI